MEDNIKKNASKLLELQKTLKGHSEIELDSFVWASAVSLMVLSDYGYIDIASDLEMDSLVPHWKQAMKIANSATAPYYDYVMGVCFCTTLTLLFDYGHFKDVENLKTTIDEAIKSISDKTLLKVESSVNSLSFREKKEATRSFFKYKTHIIGEVMGSVAYDYLTKEQLNA